jgi:peroxiredoxin
MKNEMKPNGPQSAWRSSLSSFQLPASNFRLPNLMLAIVAVLLLSFPALCTAGKFNRVLSIGDAAPDWQELPGVDDHTHGLSDYADAKLIVIVFTCNHCPVATANQERLIALQSDYKKQGVRLIAICCNPGAEDNLQAMQERAREKGYNFPYLYDAAQASGRAYGVRQTPTVFVLDGKRKLAYMGAIDDSWDDPARVERDYLRDALDALLAGEKVPVAETRPQGCEIPYLDAKGSSSSR